MLTKRTLLAALSCSCLIGIAVAFAGEDSRTGHATLIGKDALGDWTTDAPGVRRKITVNDLATPYETPSANNFPRVVKRPQGAWPKAPEGFKVTEFATQLAQPRVIVRAPNGDIFVAESAPGRIRVLRDADGDGKPEVNEVFATGLDRPFGIAFYPPGPEPKYVYVGNTNSVVGFPYKNGDTKAMGRQETIVEDIPSGQERVGGGGHWTRDLEFSPDGKTLFVSVGSRSNVTDDDTREAAGRYPGLRPRRQERAGLRLGHPQPRRPGDPSRDRRALDLGQRARRPGRPPRARLHHARREGRLLRLALVLHRPTPGPSAQGQAPRAQGQGDRPRRAAPVALGLARHDLLRRRAVPRGVQATTSSPPSTAPGTAPGAPATRSSASR